MTKPGRTIVIWEKQEQFNNTGLFSYFIWNLFIVSQRIVCQNWLSGVDAEVTVGEFERLVAMPFHHVLHRFENL